MSPNCDIEGVVTAHDGDLLDELSPLGPSQVAELREDGAILEGMITPGQMGLRTYPAESLAGGTPEENARIILRVLEGKEEGGAQAAVLLNAAGALYGAGKGDSLPESLALAREALESGAGLRKLNELKEASNAVE